MTFKSLAKSPPVILAIFLLAAGGFYAIIGLLGYTFILRNPFVPTAFVVAAIVGLAIFGVVKSFGIPKAEKPKILAISSALLPLITVFFLATKWFASNAVGGNFEAFIVLAFVALICSIILYFAYSRGTAIELILGSLQIVMVTVILGLLALVFMFESGSSSETLLSEPSPNSAYFAELVRYRSGGWSANPILFVDVRSNCDVNLLFGELRKNEVRLNIICATLSDRITLRWESNGILYVYNSNPAGGYHSRIRHIIGN